jgi:lipopolysaccharide biosynthesis protein
LVEEYSGGITMKLSSIQVQDQKIVRHYDTGVILHIYYPDMWTQIVSYLSNLGEEFDLYVTVPDDVMISEKMIQTDFPKAQIFRCENRGRDIGPFLMVFSAISQLGYQFICKIHTKKSPHIPIGRDWGEDMLGKLLGSRNIILGIKKSFTEHPDWGIIAPYGHVVPWNYYWQENVTKVTELARAIGAPFENFDFCYVAGSMFWFRPEALFPILKAGIHPQDFEIEKGQVDGTLAHAIERLLGLSARFTGYKIAESDSCEVRLSEIPFQFALLIYVNGNQQQSLRMKEEKIQEIFNSKAWKFALILRRIRLMLIPINSLRERFLKFLFRG